MNNDPISSEINPLVPLGIGIAVGICAIWIAIELLPIVVVGSAGYLVYKGLEQTKENTHGNTMDGARNRIPGQEPQAKDKGTIRTV